MALSEREAKMLEELKQREAEALDDKDLERIEANIENLFQYQDAFAALMVWNQFASHLSTLAKDNSLLVREVKRLRENENSKAMKAV
jgi:hypothetical protein